MNILLQVAGVFVMIVIFIFYFNDRKSAVKQNRLYLYQSIAIFFSLFCDIFSIVLINTEGMTYSFLTYAVCRVYLWSCLFVVYFGLLYVLGDLSEAKKKTVDIIKYSTLVVLVVTLVLITVLPLEIVYDSVGLDDYTSGIPIVLTYGGTFIFMVITILVAYFNRHTMYYKRFIAVCIFITLWIVGSGIQALFNYVLSDLGIVVLSVSFTETLGSLTIYIMLENPALNVDKVTGALTQRAFEEYLTSCYKKNSNIDFIIVDYDNTIATQVMGYNQFARAVTNLLREYKARKIFKNDRDDFIVVRNKNQVPLEVIMGKFKQELFIKNNIVVDIPFRLINFGNIKLFNDTDECLKRMNYLIDNKSSNPDLITDVNEKIASKIHQRFEIQEKCDKAFSKRKIEVYYQPIYSNHSSTFTAAEALVRLKDDEDNLIYPKDFIEDMEADGRIIELGKYVFEDVCKFISENNLEKLGLQYIEVNLSAIQCMQDNLAISYIEIIKKYNVNPKYINLEITETALSTRAILLKNMKILNKYGVSFSLDDFGTGNSNLNYVIEMPVHIVKFDKSMVNSFFENKIASFVMNSAINMIKGLGHEIVFEGIEHENQIKQIKELEVDYIQGYFYSEPVNKNSFINFMMTNN